MNHGKDFCSKKTKICKCYDPRSKGVQLKFVNTPIFVESSCNGQRLCPPGPQGPQGPRGQQGPQGQPGTPGTDGGGAIIPFSSGILTTLISALGETAGTYAIVGFGSYGPIITILGSITIVGPGAVDIYNASFVAPRDGTLTSFRAHFLATGFDISEGTSNVFASIYQSTDNLADQFTPIAQVTLNPPVTVVTVSSSHYGEITDQNINIIAGRRYFVLFGVDSTLLATVAGVASAGISIV